MRTALGLGILIAVILGMNYMAEALSDSQKVIYDVLYQN